MYLNGELWRSYFHFNLDTIDHSLLINKVILMPPNVPAGVLLPRSVNLDLLGVSENHPGSTMNTVAEVLDLSEDRTATFQFVAGWRDGRRLVRTEN